MLSVVSYIVSIVTVSSLAFGEETKKCSSRPIKIQLETLGFDLSKNTKQFNLSSEFTKDVSALAERYSNEDSKYVTSKKVVDEYLSTTKELTDKIDKVEELRRRWKNLSDKIPELSPSASNNYRNDPSLAKTIKDRDSVEAEIRKRGQDIRKESKLFFRGDSYNYCFAREAGTLNSKYYLDFENTQHLLSGKLNKFFPPENRLREGPNSYSAYRPQVEFCKAVITALKNIKKVHDSSKIKAFDTIMMPITDSPHGDEFVALFNYKEIAPFDSIENVTDKDGRSLWLVKYRGEIKTAYLLYDEKKDAASAQQFFISPAKCSLSVRDWMLESNSKFSTLRYEVNEDLCQAVREETKLSPFAWNFYDEYDSISRQAACSEQGGSTIGRKCICPKTNASILSDQETCLEMRKITPALRLSEKIQATSTLNFNLHNFKKNKDQIFKSCDTHFPSQSSAPVGSKAPSGRR